VVDLTQPMPTPNEYKQFARMCEKLANDSEDKIERAILRKMATQWRRLANHKTKHMRDRAGPAAEPLKWPSTVPSLLILRGPLAQARSKQTLD
jgi:hypothetical protein